MEKYKAIPQGYMTVGEIAKKMNTTVRTLQYYDKEGVLSPSAESEGGRRLYTDKDIIKLHQIQSMKYLGFSLDDIKTRIISLDTPADVASALNEQAVTVRKKIADLSEVLQAIEALKEEVLQMQSVDFSKYASIIVSLQMKNDYYWLIKHLDDNTLNDLRNRFDKDDVAPMIKSLNNILDKAIQLQEDGVLPESEEGQGFAKAFWDIMLKFTKGDVSLLSRIAEIVEEVDNDDSNNYWKTKQLIANRFIEPALTAYFKKLGINPFEGIENDKNEQPEENT